MTTEKGMRTKERICDAVVALINECGYDSVTVADICRRADASNGSFFHFFKTKDDVLVEFVRRESGELEAFFEGLDKSDPACALTKIIRWQAEYYRRKGEDVIAHLYAHLILSKREFVVDYALSRVLAQVVALGQERGAFRPDLDAQQLAFTMTRDTLALTAFVPWPQDGNRSIEDVLCERGEFYLRLIQP